MPRIDLPRHLYVHVPFCARRCSYCDFAIAVRATVPVEGYIAAVRTELALRFSADAPTESLGWTIDTLYFGGGTPSKLGGAGVARLLDEVRRVALLAPNAEVTLEANPEDVTAAAAAAWKAAGVSRLSLGAQSFDDTVLTWMHRSHGAVAIERAVESARSAGINNLSLDLIFALPEHVARNWERDVGRAVSLDPSHLSIYGLTIEPRTPVGRWRERGEIVEAPDERYAHEFLFAHDALAAAGYEHYEVSNFARPGRRARHNSSYWTGAAYAGVGPSAHEFDGARRRWNLAPFVEWARALRDGRDPIEGTEQLSVENRAVERVYLGLRTTDGLDATPAELDRAQAWIREGWAKLTGNRLVLRPLGWLRLDAIVAALTVVRSH